MSLWSGRFSKDTDSLVMKFGESVSFDQRLFEHDIMGSIAHVEMLAKTNLIPGEDAESIKKELLEIKARIKKNDFKFEEALEDIHMNIEKNLIDKLGDVGARIHTARSRNDQIATDIRLYLRDEIDDISGIIRGLQSTLVGLSEKYLEIIIPGFTHLQNAQPVLFSHYLLAYVEMFERDHSRLRDCKSRFNFLPLGSGALASTTLPIDRDYVAEKLGFDGLTRNSMDAVSDRDFIIEFLADLSILMMHISRLSEDIIYYVSDACSFLELDDAFCTGSSLMPQKKNPDVAELSRGKVGRVYGALISLLTIMKGLPLCYNRDIQEDKEPLFDAIDTVKMVLSVYQPMLQSMKVNKERMKEAVSDPLLMATDLAEWLVSKGVPFRTAHHKVGKLIGYCQDNHITVTDIALKQMQEIIPEATDECLSLFDPEKSVRARNIVGGTSPEQVMKQIAFWKENLNVKPE